MLGLESLSLGFPWLTFDLATIIMLLIQILPLSTVVLTLTAFSEPDGMPSDIRVVVRRPSPTKAQSFQLLSSSQRRHPGIAHIYGQARICASSHVVRRKPAAEGACAKPATVMAAANAAARGACLGQSCDALPMIRRSCGQIKVKFTVSAKPLDEISKALL